MPEVATGARITDRITEVLREHVYDVKSLIHQCECGRALDDEEPDMVPHLAAVLAETLGLTQVYSVGMLDGAGGPADWLGYNDPDWQTARNRGLCADQFVVTRHVTRWERADA